MFTQMGEGVEPAGNHASQEERLIKALEKSRDRNAEKKPWVTAVVAVINLLFMVFLLAVVIKMPWPLWIYPAAVPVLAVIFFWLASTQVHALRAFRKGIGAEIERRGILERLAMGYNELPDIHAHTVMPWRLFLGGRPRTLPDQARLVAQHLEWYLTDEPRQYFRLQWLVYALTIVPALFPVFMVYVLATRPPWLPNLPGEAIMISLIGFVVLVVMPVGAWANYLQAKQGVAADEMVKLLSKRYSE